MLTTAVVLLAVVGALGCAVLGVVVGMAYMAWFVRRQSPEAWRILRADQTEHTAVQRFALARATIRSIEEGQ
jgi:hypothetical protein